MKDHSKFRSFRPVLVRRLLDILILGLLVDKPLHGYGINARFREAFGHGLSASTLYPLLYTMEEEGYIEGEWRGMSQRKRRVYSLTKKGRKYLFSASLVLDDLTGKMLKKTVA